MWEIQNPTISFRVMAVFIDNDGSRIPVGPEDVCIIECGQSHGMENNSDEELVMMALVYNE